MTSEGLGEMFEANFALVLMGGLVEGRTCADPGARAEDPPWCQRKLSFIMKDPAECDKSGYPTNFIITYLDSSWGMPKPKLGFMVKDKKKIYRNNSNLSLYQGRPIACATLIYGKLR
jgi:hypothetical protein